ncbi:MAG: hypothetical protein CW338_01945 [Clostridiales bacterium]|nr:hypothetical protein [Clostridiales bacterium]
MVCSIRMGVCTVDSRFLECDTLVFDIGGVLLRWDPQYFAPFFFPGERGEKLFRTAFGRKDWHWGRFDLGREDNEDIARDIAGIAGVPGGEKDILYFVEHFHEYMEPLPLTRDLEELKRMGKRMYLLTNYPQPSFSRAYRRFPFFSLFDGYVCSADEKLAKPDPEIFRLLCRRFDILPEKSLFIDDNKPNTDSAAALGFRVWNYPRNE